jgi:hypothetical protein
MPLCEPVFPPHQETVTVRSRARVRAVAVLELPSGGPYVLEFHWTTNAACSARTNAGCPELRQIKLLKDNGINLLADILPSYIEIIY